MSDRISKIKTRIEESLCPETIEIEDDSAKHIGHEGAKGGLGHFNIIVVADSFKGQPLIKRHRMIYAAVGNLMKTDIHALSIKAYTPDEYTQINTQTNI